MAIVGAPELMVRRAGAGDVTGPVQFARWAASVADEPPVAEGLDG
ncbi:hypothetical protein ACFV1C_03975 [Streptomyces sp. NPDC059605]